MVKVDSAAGWEFEIAVDGTPAAEYDDPDGEETASSASKYIESKSNSRWSLRAIAKYPQFRTSENHSWLLEICCDGQKVRRCYAYIPSKDMWNLRRNRKITTNITQLCYEHHGQTYARALKFGEIVTTEDALTQKHKELIPKIAKFGTIELKLWRYTDDGPGTELSTFPPDPKPTMMDSRLPEKALKGRSLSHSFGLDEQSVPLQSQTVHRGSPVSSHPEATFIWKYLSKDALKSMMIIPRTPTPETEDGLDHLSAEDLRAKLRSMNSQTRSQSDESKVDLIRRLKREASVDDDEIAVVSAPRKKPARVETIDLTDL